MFLFLVGMFLGTVLGFALALITLSVPDDKEDEEDVR